MSEGKKGDLEEEGWSTKGIIYPFGLYVLHLKPTCFIVGKRPSALMKGPSSQRWPPAASCDPVFDGPRPAFSDVVRRYCVAAVARLLLHGSASTGLVSAFSHEQADHVRDMSSSTTRWDGVHGEFWQLSETTWATSNARKKQLHGSPD